MDINELSKNIAEDIKEAKKTRKLGYVAFAIKINAQDIKRILDETFYRIPDLFGHVSEQLGEDPCDIRNFRRACNKYCQENDTFSVGKGMRKNSIEKVPNTDGDISKRSDGDNESFSHAQGDGGLGEDWNEIIESLGPLKRQQLPEAIEAGLTLDVAKEARSKSTKALKEILTTYCMKRKL